MNKFLVLWRKLVFLDTTEPFVNAGPTDQCGLMLDCETTNTIEDGIRLYNKLVSDDVNQQVMILQVVKSFERGK